MDVRSASDVNVDQCKSIYSKKKQSLIDNVKEQRLH